MNAWHRAWVPIVSYEVGMPGMFAWLQRPVEKPLFKFYIHVYTDRLA